MATRMRARFTFPTRIIFGPGVLGDELGGVVKDLPGSRPLLVTDPGLREAGIVDRVVDALSAGGLDVAVFDRVSPNPTGREVEAGAEMFAEHGADCIVAVGGGSPMDAGKGVQLRIHHKEPLHAYDDLTGGDAKITGPLPPLVAVPTTAGTGAEVSRSAVITVEAVERKVVIFSGRLMPTVALCDPELTYGLPPKLTAETGMDALSHNVEAYFSKGYHPMADGIALEAIRMVCENLGRAVEEGSDERARREMMMASTMGAVAFQKGLGVAHSLAHALSPVTGMSHGLANAILIPHVVRFNGEAAPGKVEMIGRAAGLKNASAAGVARFFEKLVRDTGLPNRLSEAGVEESHLGEVVKKAMVDGCHGANPRPCGAKEMESLFMAAF